MFDNGAFMRFSNISYIMKYSDKIIVGTTPCTYELMLHEEIK